MSEKPRILVLTLSFGAGHVRAAQSIVAELERQTPDAEIRLVDALENCSLWFRAFYVWTYFAMIRFAPRLWKHFFESRTERKDEFSAPVWAWQKGCRQVFAEIKEFQPGLIVACEVGAAEIAVLARREKLTNAEIVNVITDFETEPIWVKPEISAFAVASEEVKIQLQNWGADAEKIKVCGIPIDESFGENHDAEKTRERFNLDARPIVLLMGGGSGPTRMSEVAARLLQSDANFQIAALPAKDAKAKAELEKLADSPTVALRVIGWTSLIAELMQAADILATKPGGLTLSEAAACGLPCVLFDAIPGPEETNAAYFAAHEASVQTYGSAETAAEILRLLENSPARMRLAANIKKLARIEASEKIVCVITETLRSSNPEKIFAPSKKLSAYRKALAVWHKLETHSKDSKRQPAVTKDKEISGNFNEPFSGIEAK